MTYWWSDRRCLALQDSQAGSALVAGNAAMESAPPCSPTETGDGGELRPVACEPVVRSGGAHQGDERAGRAQARPSGSAAVR